MVDHQETWFKGGDGARYKVRMMKQWSKVEPEYWTVEKGEANKMVAGGSSKIKAALLSPSDRFSFVHSANIYWAFTLAKHWFRSWGESELDKFPWSLSSSGGRHTINKQANKWMTGVDNLQLYLVLRKVNKWYLVLSFLLKGSDRMGEGCALKILDKSG